MMEEQCLTLPSEGLEALKCEDSRSALISAVSGKFDCTIKFQNLEETASAYARGGKSKNMPQIFYSKQLYNGVHISVLQDDLTSHTVDAVVNAANEILSHGAGLALALSQAGGPDINKSSKDIIRHYGKVRTGSAVLAPAGNLPCKYIIHAVGPSVSHSPLKKEIDEATFLLQNTFQRILQLADTNNLQSVAIPAISSGIFNFPLQLCAEIIVNTVMSYSHARNSGQNRIEVRLVNNDDKTVCEMERACKKFLGPSESPNMTGAVQKQPSTQSVLPRLVLGNVTLILKTGSIEDECVDVIVNITGTDLDLSKGMVSFALLGKAGHKIQQEINKFNSWHSNVSVGDVLETSGCFLKCKSVFHVVCDQKTNANKVIFPVVKKCLEKASNKKVSSISFPAIGTGTLGLKKDEVAGVIIKAAIHFSKFYSGKKMDINIVIFPRDTETLRAFEREMARVDPEMFSTTSKSQVSQGGVEEKKPGVIFLGNSTEVIKEAKKWTLNILNIRSNNVTIKNNHIAHLDQDHHAKLATIQATFNVVITEFFDGSKSGIIINGDSVSVSQAALKVEEMLCKIQEQFAATEEKEINRWYNSGSMEKSGRRSIDPKSSEYSNIVDEFKATDLLVEKVEKIENPALKKLFELNAKRVGSKAQTLYQRVNAQFCNLICRVGFQREYAPPKEQKFGAGIYFTTKVTEAESLWPCSDELYVYIIIARVLTGKDVSNPPNAAHLILPPPITSDPLSRYDSVANYQKDIFVIFNGQQALPEFIITCRQKSTHV